MARTASKYPTELELMILKILWREGSATIRIVRDLLADQRDLAYNSVMTIMNIMRRKGYLKRAKRDGSYVYSPQISEQATMRRMLSDLVDRVFDGSAAGVGSHDSCRIDVRRPRAARGTIRPDGATVDQPGGASEGSGL